MTPTPVTPRLKLLDQLREQIRYRHYSLRTEEAYVYWVRAYVRWAGMKHPKSLGGRDVEAFLAHLASERQLSASTHRQALSALLFLYKEVIGVDLPWMKEIGRPVRKTRLPAVFSVEEVQRPRVRHQNADFAFLVKPLPCESTTYAHFCGSFVVATA